MAYGMTYQEYWNCEPERYFVYRELHKLDIKRRNEELWLQGLYNFEAISTALSNIHLDNKQHKVNKYRSEPYDLFAKPEEKSEAEVEKAKQKVIDQLNAWKARWEASKASKGNQ